jgi:hypothetical protein
MRFVLQKPLVTAVLIAFASYVLPVDTLADKPLTVGKETSDEAAKVLPRDKPLSNPIRSLRYAVPMAGGYAQPDTTGFDFPEEEEKHLVRDIAVFVIVSAFVAYFLIKVFLEGDTDENGTEDEGGGKPPPPV